jgi:hypothetical protein
MITIKQITLTTLVALALTGCTQERSPENPSGDTNREVIFSINVPGSSNPSSRALSDGDESEVKSIEMLIFDPSTKKMVHNPVFADAITSDPDNDGNFRKKSFSVRLPEGTFDIMIFANARAVFGSASISAGEAQDEILAKLKISMPATGWTANPSDAAKRYLIPVGGMKENLVIGTGTTISGIYLHRMLSRIDVSITGDVAETGNFKLKGIKIHNIQKEGRIAPALANWNKNGLVNNSTVAAGLAVLPSLTGSGVYAAPISYASAIAADRKGCVREMYIFEAPKAAGHADQNAPFLTIKGEYNGVEGWYRIDLADYATMNYLDVLRNHLYSIGISKVFGAGFPNEKDAMQHQGENIMVDVTLWNEFDLGGTVFDGTYFLSVRPQEISYNKDAQTPQAIVIKTDNNLAMTVANIKVSNSESDPNAGLPGNWINGFTLSPKTVANGHNAYMLTYNVAQNNGGVRHGYIHVTLGRLTNVVHITQSNTN